jgi:hypothetical protein
MADEASPGELGFLAVSDQIVDIEIDDQRRRDVSGDGLHVQFGLLEGWQASTEYLPGVRES